MRGEEVNRSRGLAGHIGLPEVMLVVIFLVSGAGVAITDMSPDWGYWFWLGLSPLLALTSLYSSWIRVRAHGGSKLALLRTQIFHWLGLLGTLEIVFILYNTNRINAAEAGQFSLLAVALATFLAGIHFHWHFIVLGIMLGVSTIAVAWIEASVWIIIPIALALVAGVLWFSIHSSRKAKQ